MTIHAHRHGGSHHDWHSGPYVDRWISGDVTRDDERRPLVRRMLDLAPCAADAAIRVLDVGGGYGVVTEEVLQAFPNAHVTLQDYSTPMLEQARLRLGAYLGRVSFEQRDFARAGWTAGLGGPFDLAVSGIAIHNLGHGGPIPQVYRSICGVLTPGGAFLNLDYVSFTGGFARHVEWLSEAGFERMEQAFEAHGQAAIAAFRA